MFDTSVLIKKYFEERSFVNSTIESFNHFIEVELQKIVEENKEIEPTIIPHNIDEFKIRLERIWIDKPFITEADGSTRPIFPVEARLRKLTYAAPIHMEISAHINGVQRESFSTQIGSMPIMLKSKNCHLSGMSQEDLIKHNEDPSDFGGYFIINGSEKVVINIEDLAQNRLIVDTGSTPGSFIGRLFSEYGAFKIPHSMEKLKDGIYYITFTRVRRIPIIVLVKALGMLKDEEIMKAICGDQEFDDVFVNLFEFAEIKNEDDAIDFMAKGIGITQSKDIRVDRMREILDKYLMPHLGIKPRDRIVKAMNLCKFMRRLILVSRGDIQEDDKDNYMNKRLKLSGNLLADLFRTNLKVLIGDILYNFQRIVKRGKFPSIRVVIRDKLLTQRIYSAMATGNWVGGRKGICQRIQRLNYLDTLSHLQRVVSPLSSSQENFAARELHPTHMGRLCPVESPEGTNIGLRKNLSIMASVSGETPAEEVMRTLKDIGLRPV